MRVKAKWSVKDATGWHDAGQVFETESDLGDAVEVLDAPKKQPAGKPEAKKQEPVKEPEPETTAETKEPEKEPEKAAEAPRSTSRRKKAN